MSWDILIWWTRQLSSILPTSDNIAPQLARNALVLRAGPASEDGPIDLTLRRSGNEAMLGRFASDRVGVAAARQALADLRPARPATTVIRIGQGAVLERDVTLPLAAERAPAQVLHHEIGRLTPFIPADVVWSWRPLARDAARRQVTLRLALVPRSILQGAIAALARLDITPTLLEAEDDTGTPKVFDLLRAPDTLPMRGRGRVVALAGCGGLAAFAIALPFVLQWREAIGIDAELEALRPAMAEVEALRRQLAEHASGGDLVLRERLRCGQPLQLLATLTELLPDDSHLTELSLGAGQLVAQGRSAAAAGLIAALGSDPVFRNPSFVAPVRRSEDGRADLFALRAEYGP
jgi:general secretion pathway protein L